MSRDLLPNIRKYYLYQFFSNMAFFSPVIILFYQSRGLNLTQSLTIQSIYAIGVVIMEVPTGIYADLYGKRKSLALGALFFTFGLIAYFFSLEFWQFAASEIICAVGMAFVSGADSAFIHETLKSLGREDEYKKVEGKARGVMRSSVAFGEILSGLVASVSLAFTLLASSISTFIAFLVALSFQKPSVHLGREERTNYKKVIFDSIRIIHQHPTVLWLTIFFAVFNGLLGPTSFVAQVYMQSLHIPVIYFGVIFAAFSIGAAIASVYTHWFDSITGSKNFLIMTTIVYLAMIALGTIPSIVVFPVWVVFNAFMMINVTLVSDTVLKIVPHNQASTVLSFQNLLRRAVYALAGPLIGYMSDTFSVFLALKVYAMMLLIFIIPLFLFKPRKLV